MNDFNDEAWFEPLIGDRFGERFRADSYLGEGGFGGVLAGVDEKLERAVAIKVVLDNKISTNRMIAEAKRLARLAHPGILLVFDYGEHDWHRGKLPYIVTEQLPQSLDDLRTSRGGRIPVEEAILITEQILDSVAHAHGAKIMHRDLHFGNVMIDALGNPRIIDFGLAKADDDLTSRSRNIAGYQGYIAPERYERAKNMSLPEDYRSDLWSIGLLFVEMCTGGMPWDVENPAFIAYAACHDPHRSVSAILADETLRPLDGFVDRMLAKDPTGRPDTAADAKEILRTVAAELRIPSWPRSGSRRPVIAVPEPTRHETGPGRPGTNKAAYWWVNQGISFDAERQAGILGAGTVHWTHRTMRELQPGDLVLHYAVNRIRAISRVESAAVEVRPGRLEAKTRYFDVGGPIMVADIPDSLKDSETTATGGPFRRDGKVHQGYLFRISSGFVEQVAEQFADAWPKLA